MDSGIVSPKFTAGYILSPYQELSPIGEKLSQQRRPGLTDTLDPQTQAPYDALGQPVLRIRLNRADGLEFGYRYSRGGAEQHASLWQLHLNSELIFDGDAGVTSCLQAAPRCGEASSLRTSINLGPG